MFLEARSTKHGPTEKKIKRIAAYHIDPALSATGLSLALKFLEMRQVKLTSGEIEIFQASNNSPSLSSTAITRQRWSWDGNGVSNGGIPVSMLAHGASRNNRSKRLLSADESKARVRKQRIGYSSSNSMHCGT